MEINITEISPEEAENISFRTSHKWDMENMETFAKDLVNKYSGKIVRIPITEFYKEFYTGDSVIKHQSYYCKKKLKTVLENLNIDCKVSATLKWDGVLVLQISSGQEISDEEEEPEEEEKEEEEKEE